MSQGLDRFNSRYVYRVLRPDEDPNSDIICSAPLSQRTLCEHVESGLRHPSRFISTSNNLTEALRWMAKANEKSSLRYVNTRNVIVKIDVELLKSKHSHIAENAYDLSDVLNREKYLKTKLQKGYSTAYGEVVFRDVIPAEAVSIEYSRLVGDTEASNSPSKQLHQTCLNESQTKLPSKGLTLREKRISAIKSPAKSKISDPSKGIVTTYKAHTYSPNGRANASTKTAARVPPILSQQLIIQKKTHNRNLSNPALYLSFSPLENLVQIIRDLTM